MLLENIRGEAFVASALKGYRIAPCCSNYGGVNQRWLMVESEARKKADIQQLEKRLAKQLSKAQFRSTAVVSTGRAPVRRML